MLARYKELLHIAERSIVTPLDLLQFVVVSQVEQRPLNVTHLPNLPHHILIDAVQDFLFKQINGTVDHRAIYVVTPVQKTRQMCCVTEKK